MKKLLMVLGVMLAAVQANAQNLDAGKIYFGGGLGYNDINRINYDDSAVGFQIFAGLPFAVTAENLKFSAEIGYMDSGDFNRDAPFTSTAKANGLWGTAVAELSLNENVSLLGRLGLDIGDDDGVMIGAGAGFAMSRKMDLRLEYVIRDNIDSLQLNLVVRQ